jgi:DeoR/GlpR family transcriptional regulator of sugar metabolism
VRYDNATERRARIVALVQEAGFRSSSELSELLNVSDNTIRRDIQRLMEQGLLEAVHGGARVNTPHFSGDHSFQSRVEENRQSKQAIANYARGFVKPGSILALDAGTTVLELAQLLPTDMNLTVVTHSLPVITALLPRQDIELIGLGGGLRKDTQAFAGSLTTHAIKEVRVNTLFLATKAVRDNAMYSGNPYDAEVKRALISISDQVILLVDSSKFFTSAGMRVASLEEIDIIVVDNRANISELVNPKALEIVVVPEEEEDR